MGSSATHHYGVAASPPPLLPRLHGEGMVEGLLRGEASRRGSTPQSKVITVDTPFGPPSVATTMTASPFCKSASVAAGMRPIICCRSPEPPPPGLPIPPDLPEPGLSDGVPLGFMVGLPLTAAPAAPVAHADRFTSGGSPFRRMAIRCAIGAGSLRDCDSAVILTMTCFFETRS